MARMVQCIKLNKEAEGMDFAPLPGELGKKIWNQVSKEAWAGWLKQQTMLINENRLNMADPRARQYLLKQVEKHFFEGGADTAQGYVPPAEQAALILLRHSNNFFNLFIQNPIFTVDLEFTQAQDETVARQLLCPATLAKAIKNKRIYALIG